MELEKRYYAYYKKVIEEMEILTAVEFSEQTGQHRTVYYRYIKGSKNFKADKLFSIGKKLGVKE